MITAVYYFNDRQVSPLVVATVMLLINSPSIMINQGERLEGQKLSQTKVETLL